MDKRRDEPIRACFFMQTTNQGFYIKKFFLVKLIGDRKEVNTITSIKCNVTECNYNKNIQCDAPMIQVARDGSLSHAKNSDNTKCETFKPKG